MTHPNLTDTLPNLNVVNMDIVSSLISKVVKALPLWRQDLKIHPSERSVDEKTRILARLHGKKYHSSLTRLSSYVYCYLSEQMFLLANNWHMWLWVTDDDIDNPTLPLCHRLSLARDLIKIINDEIKRESDDQRYPRIKRIFREIRVYPHGCLSLLQEILHQLRTFLLPHRRKIYLYLLRETKDYLEKGVITKLLTDEMSLERYNEIRYYDGACNTVWPLMLLDELEDYDLDEFSEANTYANKIVSLTNDLISYRKDVERDKTTYNYLVKYMLENKVSFEETLEHVKERISGDYTALCRLNEEVAFSSSSYIKRLILWCQGSLIWHLISPRYLLSLEE
jgi:hypothetical protein